MVNCAKQQSHGEQHETGAIALDRQLIATNLRIAKEPALRRNRLFDLKCQRSEAVGIKVAAHEFTLVWPANQRVDQANPSSPLNRSGSRVKNGSAAFVPMREPKYTLAASIHSTTLRLRSGFTNWL